MTVDVKAYLTEQNIPFQAFAHRAVFHCEAEPLHPIRGVDSKNLLLKDSKSRRFYLVVVPVSVRVNLKAFGAVVGDRLKLANEQDLERLLGVSRGAVSPFGLLNDAQGLVQLWLHSEVVTSPYVYFHPNVNTESLELTQVDFQRYLAGLKNKWQVLSMGEYDTMAASFSQ